MIKLVVFDFDGVFTDGKIYFDNSENILKHYNVKDGMGISKLHQEGYEIGVISGWTNNKSQQLILEHLKIKRVSFGSNDKLTVLKRWCDELKISLNDVAYMGDDLNDLEVMAHVGFVACPAQSIDEVKDVSNFICNHEGGNGAIRELCDFILNNKNKFTDTVINQIKKESLFQLNNFNLDEINALSKLIIKTSKTNNIFFLAVGKSLNIAQHSCSILNSININCFVINPLNSIHGDIGCLKQNDLVICYSKSGNTSELINLIPFIQKKGCKIIGICCKSHLESKFKSLCDQTVILPFNNEIKNKNISSIPTNSYMVFVYFTNILTFNIINNSDFSVDNYKINHPAGNIGINLKQIKDVLIKDFPKINLETKIHINSVLLEMTKFKIGCCFFVNTKDELLGILTDGDIRRILIKQENIKFISSSDINCDFYYEKDKNKYIKDCKKVNYIPFLENKIIKGILTNY